MNNMAKDTEEFSRGTEANLGSLGNKKSPRFDIRLQTGGTDQAGADNTGTIRGLINFPAWVCLVLCSPGPDPQPGGSPWVNNRGVWSCPALLLSQDINATLCPPLAVCLVFVTGSYTADTLPCLTRQLKKIWPNLHLVLF